MNLKDFLNAAGTGRPAPTCPVRFKVLGFDPNSATAVSAEASAVLVCLTEQQRQKAEIDGAKSARKLSEGNEPTVDLVTEETAYHVLYQALRDAEDPAKYFAGTVTELKTALVGAVATDLMSTYKEFLEREFPPEVTVEDFREMVEAAKKDSLASLLSSGNLRKVVRCLPGLVRLFGTSHQQM